MDEQVKTSFILPKKLYLELKRRAVEEDRTVREVLIDAIASYLSLSGEKEARSKLMELILSPVQGAGPEDLREYGYEDVG